MTRSITKKKNNQSKKNESQQPQTWSDCRSRENRSPRNLVAKKIIVQQKVLHKCKFFFILYYCTNIIELGPTFKIWNDSPNKQNSAVVGDVAEKESLYE